MKTKQNDANDLDFESLGLISLDFSAPDTDLILAELSRGEVTTDKKPGTHGTKKQEPTAGAATGAGHRAAIKTKAKRRYFYDIATSVKALEHILELPGLDETLHCVMGGDYHAFDVLLAIRDRGQSPIQSLTITTLGFKRHNISHLCQIIAGGECSDVQILCSDYLESVDTKLFLFAREALAEVGAVLRADRNHSKILCIDFGERQFVVESSANLRSCNKLEQFTLTQSPELYSFHREWIRRAITAKL